MSTRGLTCLLLLPSLWLVVAHTQEYFLGSGFPSFGGWPAAGAPDPRFTYVSTPFGARQLPSNVVGTSFVPVKPTPPAAVRYPSPKPPQTTSKPLPARGQASSTPPAAVRYSTPKPSQATTKPLPVRNQATSTPSASARYATPRPSQPTPKPLPGRGRVTNAAPASAKPPPAAAARLQPPRPPPAAPSLRPRLALAPVRATPTKPAAAVREDIIFAEEFNELDPNVWSHLVTAWRGGNREFQYYRNDRSNSYVKDGVLYLRPTLTASEQGEAFLYTGSLYYPDCNFEPCVSASGSDIVLPIQSARIHTSKSFSFRYGRLEVRAKLPRGDWIWPAIWLKPATNAYGPWPASGEMDLVESRGNANLKQASSGEPQGVQKVGATLHFGPNSSYNIWQLSHWDKILEQGDFADDFHVFGMEWSPIGFRFTVDGEEIGRMGVPEGGFWNLGGFDSNPGGPNIWANGTDMAPFDRKFYIILNVAVGGTFFPNGFINSPYPRPWNWTSGHPLREFWEHRDWWLPTWRGEDAAMQVDYVRVYQNVT